MKKNIVVAKYLIPYSFVLIHMPWLTHTPHKTNLQNTSQDTELGNFCVISAFCSLLVLQNGVITWKLPSSACIAVGTCLYCISGYEEEWISEVWSTQTQSMTTELKWWLLRSYIQELSTCVRLNERTRYTFTDVILIDKNQLDQSNLSITTTPISMKSCP